MIKYPIKIALYVLLTGAVCASIPTHRYGCTGWRFNTQGPVYTSTAIDSEGQIYATDKGGYVYCLDKQGSRQWIADANSPVLTSPIVSPDGRIIVGCQNGDLLTYDATGSELWRKQTSGMIYSTPAVFNNGDVCFGSQDGAVYCLDDQGQEKWKFTIPGPSHCDSPVLSGICCDANDVAYITSLYDPNVYCLDGTSGQLIWASGLDHYQQQLPSESHLIKGGFFTAPVMGPEKTLYVCSVYEPLLFALHSQTGQLLWRTNMIEPFETDPNYLETYPMTRCLSEPAIGTDGTVYVSLDDPYLRAYNQDGSVKWITRLGGLGGFTISVDGKGDIYAAGDDGSLYVLDPQGHEISRYDGVGSLSCPVVTDDGDLLLSDTAGGICLISDNCPLYVLELTQRQDIDKNASVNLSDVTEIGADWMRSYAPEADLSDPFYLPADINRDFKVDMADLIELAEGWLWYR